jgi:Resolvase, N terminal domain
MLTPDSLAQTGSGIELRSMAYFGNPILGVEGVQTMRAAIYARKSTRDARDADDPDKSVARQQALAREFSASRGWGDVVASYTDDGVSGMHRTRLVGRAEMFLAAEQGRFDVLIVRDTDRLSRDDMEPDPVVTLKSAGVTVWAYSTGRPVDVSDATDRLVRNVHRYRGASEAESGSKRTRDRNSPRRRRRRSPTAGSWATGTLAPPGLARGRSTPRRRSSSFAFSGHELAALATSRSPGRSTRHT